MPWSNPDEHNPSVNVRLPSDPPPRRPSRNGNDARRREIRTDPHVLGENVPSSYLPETELEALMMAAPGDRVESAEELDREQPYFEAVGDAYAAALPSLTGPQRAAWDLFLAGLSERQMSAALGIDNRAAARRVGRAASRLGGQMDWVIDPALRAKYRKPKPPAKPRPIAQIRCSQHVGTWLARSDYDDAARWQVGRGLDMAIGVGSSPTELIRRTQILPARLAQLISEYRNG